MHKLARAVVIALALAVLGGRPLANELMVVRWAGFTAAGDAPPALASRVRSHVVVALKTAGVHLTEGGVPDGELSAQCAFPRGAVRARAPAHCEARFEWPRGQVRVRKLKLPFSDVEELAATLALITVELVQSSQHTGGDEEPLLADPSPAEPTPPSLPEVPRPAVASAPAVAPPKTPAAPRPAAPSRALVASAPSPTATVPTLSRSFDRSSWPERLRIDVLPLLTVGLNKDPLLYGADLLVLFAARKLLRAGGAVSVVGTDAAPAGIRLRALRGLVGPTVGVGFATRHVSLDVLAGPALLALQTSAVELGAQHVMLSFAGRLELVFGVRLYRSLSLRVAATLVAAATKQEVVAASVPIASFGPVSFDVGLGLSYAR